MSKFKFNPYEYTNKELLEHVKNCSGEIIVDSYRDSCPICEEYCKRNAEPNLPCICEGNWRNIIKESEPLMGKVLLDENGCSWLFHGVLWAKDDFYYLFSDSDHKYVYVSCCVTLEQAGMRLI